MSYNLGNRFEDSIFTTLHNVLVKHLPKRDLTEGLIWLTSERLQSIMAGKHGLKIVLRLWPQKCKATCSCLGTEEQRDESKYSLELNSTQCTPLLICVLQGSSTSPRSTGSQNSVIHQGPSVQPSQPIGNISHSSQSWLSFLVTKCSA